MVQVYYKNEWAYVCNDGWKDIHAEIVCKQLGHETGAAEKMKKLYPTDDIRMMLHMGSKCTGCEINLMECEYFVWESQLEMCDHNEVAQVKCHEKGKTKYYIWYHDNRTYLMDCCHIKS